MQEIVTNGHSEEDPRFVQVQNGLKAMADMQREKDFLQKQQEELSARCKGTEAELGALNLAYQRLLGEIEQYRRERDEAVGRAAATAAIFSAVLEIMQKHHPQNPTATEGSVAAIVAGVGPDAKQGD